MFTIATEEHYEDGQLIFEEGTSGDWIYVVQSGSIEISKTVQGKKYVIALLKPGEVFGELAFIARIKRTATARAIGETTIGVIDRDIFEREFNQLSSQFRSILQTIVLRMKGMLDRVSQFSERSEPRHPRVLSLVFKDRQSFVRSYTENVSMGGLFVRTENLLASGLKFLLKLQIPGVSDPLQIKSEVAWTRKRDENHPDRPPGMGIRFCEMSDKDRQTLDQYLSGETQEQ